MIRKFPAVAALAAVVAGIVLSDNSSFPAWLWLMMAIVSLVIALWFWARQKNAATAGLAIMTLLFFSGFSYSYAMKTFPPGHVVHYADGQSKYIIYATVDDWPVVKDKYSDIFARVDSLEMGGTMTRVAGRILIHVGSGSNFVQYGDRVIVSGRLYPIRGGPNPNGFDYRRYLNLRSVFAVLYLPHQYGIRVDPAGKGSLHSAIEYLRRQILGVFNENLGNDPAALASGFLIGETRHIGPDIYELFRDTGTLHLLAVSGSNVGLVILVFLLLLRAAPMRRTGRTVFLLVIILIFSFLSYNQPSVVRAALMAALVLLGRCFQRRIDYNNIIAAAALIILLVEPVQLYDIGFQLSFATAWGLIFIMPRFSSMFRPVHRSRLYRYIAFPFMVCLVAQIVSLPLSAYYFNRLPVISFLSNMVIVPLVSVTVVGEIILLFAALVIPVLATLVGSLLNPLLLLVIELLAFFNSISWSLHRGFMPSAGTLLVYFALVILAALAISSLRARRCFVFAIVLSTIGLTTVGLLDSRDENEITVLSVSSGYIAISQTVPALVIMADLSLKDYTYTEKIIQPLLDNWGITDFETVVISGNYATIREGLLSSRLSNSGRLYMPRIYAGLARDLVHEMSLPADSGTFVFLDNREHPLRDDDFSVFLASGLAILNAGRSHVVFADDEFSRLEGIFKTDGGWKSCCLVVPKTTAKHLRLMESVTNKGDYAVISNRLDLSDHRSQSQTTIPGDTFGKSVILSQVGAASIVMRDGRFRVK